jgi:acetyl-CoA carboxylase biotin carboxylase subunit
MHVQLADIALCIGPASSTDSYLKIANLISAAEVADVDAIHPGYGFLAENAHFAEICANCNIHFIGPSGDNIRRMGDKAVARETMKKAGVPVTPGSEGVIHSQEEALELAQKMGYPVLIKAVAGGGGKGMRVARNDVSLAQGFMTASSEAERSFGNPAVYLEKYIEQARHVEVQVIGDHHGNVVHLGERDCSIQRRHQKLLEEAPCPVLAPDTRKKLGRAALRAADAVKYRSAGTVEFLYDEQTTSFYFMEMNTRIQVEHPVTEEVTGIDIIKEQIRVAAGEKLSFNQKDIQMRGHSIEFRVNAEDPARDFTPSPGRMEWVHFPGGHGVRVDSHVYSGCMISPHYDSMIAKLIVRGDDRLEAIARMSRALEEFLVEWPATTVPLGQALMLDARFVRGEYNTDFLDRFMEEGFSMPS